MARTVAGLPEGERITDYVSLGVIVQHFPMDTVRRILKDTGRESVRQRLLPAHVMVYYVIGLALYMEVSYGEVLRCLVDGLEWLGLPTTRLRNVGRSSISEARTRLGADPVEQLYREVVQPVATPKTRGAWYRGWRVVSIDGSTLDIADTKKNEAAFGRPGVKRGKAGFPQLRFVALAEIGTHVLFGARMGPYKTSENRLADELLSELTPEMLCIADRGFFSYERWCRAMRTGADLLWRVKKDLIFPCLERLDDGSYLSKIYPSATARRNDRDGVVVRVIEYILQGADKPKEVYRLITTILDVGSAPAKELAALYHERWEIETALDEFKTHLRGRSIVLRSKTPELVRQEFYGLMLAHFAIRNLMHDAALRGGVDTDTLSFVHAVRVVRRRLPRFVSIPPSAPKGVSHGNP
jgi:hypothetical protein